MHNLLSCKRKNKIYGPGIKLLISLFFLIFSAQIGFSRDDQACFKLSPLQVGQYVEYQIISFENQSRENRYKISVLEKEKIKNQDYFWIGLEISCNGKPEISFKALTAPFSQVHFSENPDIYISEGMFLLLKNSHRLIVILDNGFSYEVSPKDFFAQSDIFKDTFYKTVPDEKNEVDYSKMKIINKTEKIQVPAGIFDCYHFKVKTHEQDDYTDEGFDLWRSPKVPFLGIVKMDFSKTEYLKKWNYQYAKRMNEGNWLSKLYAYFFLRRVPGRDRKDIFVMELIDYGVYGSKG